MVMGMIRIIGLVEQRPNYMKSCKIPKRGVFSTPSFFTGIRRKGLRIPAPRCFDNADAYAYWCRTLLSYADFHVFIGFLTGYVKIASSHERSQGQEITSDSTSRSFEDSIISEFDIRTCCVDHVFQLMWDIHSSITFGMRRKKSITLAQGADLDRHVHSSELTHGEDLVVVSDRLAGIDEDLPRLAERQYTLRHECVCETVGQ